MSDSFVLWLWGGVLRFHCFVLFLCLFKVQIVVHMLSGDEFSSLSVILQTDSI